MLETVLIIGGLTALSAVFLFAKTPPKIRKAILGTEAGLDIAVTIGIFMIVPFTITAIMYAVVVGVALSFAFFVLKKYYGAYKYSIQDGQVIVQEEPGFAENLFQQPKTLNVNSNQLNILGEYRYV